MNQHILAPRVFNIVREAIESKTDYFQPSKVHVTILLLLGAIPWTWPQSQCT